jgi:hypothetical protein
MFEFLNFFRRIGDRKRERLKKEKAMKSRRDELYKAEQEAKRYLEFMAHLQEIAIIVQEHKQSKNDIY